METVFDTGYVYAGKLRNSLMLKKSPQWNYLSKSARYQCMKEAGSKAYDFFEHQLEYPEYLNETEMGIVRELLFEEAIINAERHGHKYELKPTILVSACKKPAFLMVTVDQQLGQYDVRAHRIENIGKERIGGLDRIIQVCDMVVSENHKKMGGMKLNMKYKVRKQ